MIKRQNWAVSYGGGEYGSEDSSDSDLDEEEAEDENVLSTAASSLSWAESVKVTEEISSDEEDGINLYANVALRGPMQTAKIGGYRGKSFERQPSKSIVPSDEEESDGGISSEGEGEAARFADKHAANESKKEKLGRMQREARRLKARRQRKSDLLAKKQAAAVTMADDAHMASGAAGEDEEDEEEDDAVRARKEKLRGKIERFTEHAEKYKYTVDAADDQAGRTMYRSPLFPELKIYSAEQLRHHMLTKKYKRAEQVDKLSKMKPKARAAFDEQKKAKREKKQAKQAAKKAGAAAATKGEDVTDGGADAKSKADEGGSAKSGGGGGPGKKKRKRANDAPEELTEEQIAARKAKFAAKKARREERKAAAGGGSGGEGEKKKQGGGAAAGGEVKRKRTPAKPKKSAPKKSAEKASPAATRSRKAKAK